MTKKKDTHYFGTIEKKLNRAQRFAVLLIKKYPRIKASIDSGLAVDSRDKKLYDVISDVIFKTKFLPNGYDRLEQIERRYWKNEKITVKDYASEKVVDTRTAMLWLYDFVNAVAESI